METTQTSKQQLLDEYRALCIQRLNMRGAGVPEMVALAKQTGAVLGLLRYIHHVNESELDAIRAAVIAGGVQ